MQEFSDKHKRAIHSLARMVETKLIDLEGFFHTADSHVPVCITMVNDLTRGQEKEINQVIQKLYDLLRDYCAKYEIKRTELSLKKEVLFKSAMLWQELAGATGKSLEGYGYFDDRAKNEFDLFSTEMTKLVNEIYTICNN